VKPLPPLQEERLRSLAAVFEADPRCRAFELQCSLARGAGDELSDLDVGLWLADEELEEAVAALPVLVESVAPVADLLPTQLAGEAHVFAEWSDGLQLDLWAPRASRAKGRAPGAVVLFDKDGLLETAYEPPSYRGSPEDTRVWSVRAWVALSNLAKYLRRTSLWEALAALDEARKELLRLHARSVGIPYAEFGLTSLLDEEVPLPERLSETVAGLDPGELRRAGLVVAELLQPHPEPGFADAVRQRLRG
jgi:hypothetical protein